MCSILLDGVENGSVDLTVYQNVCQFSSPREQIADALRTADLGHLLGLDDDPETVAILSEPLADADIAARFLAAATGEMVGQWVAKATAAGLDPNLLSGDRPSERRSLLDVALDGDNVDAAIALLAHGASPHTYATLWGMEGSRPDMLWPLDRIEDVAATRDRKAALIRAMVAAGMTWPGASDERAISLGRRYRRRATVASSRPRWKALTPRHPRIPTGDADATSRPGPLTGAPRPRRCRPGSWNDARAECSFRSRSARFSRSTRTASTCWACTTPPTDRATMEDTASSSPISVSTGSSTSITAGTRAAWGTVRCCEVGSTAVSSGSRRSTTSTRVAGAGRSCDANSEAPSTRATYGADWSAER